MSAASNEIKNMIHKLALRAPELPAWEVRDILSAMNTRMDEIESSARIFDRSRLFNEGALSERISELRKLNPIWSMDEICVVLAEIVKRLPTKKPKRSKRR